MNHFTCPTAHTARHVMFRIGVYNLPRDRYIFLADSIKNNSRGYLERFEPRLVLTRSSSKDAECSWELRRDHTRRKPDVLDYWYILHAGEIRSNHEI